MERFPKIVRFTSVLLLILSILGCASIPKLSKEQKKAIRSVLKAAPPEVVKGETGFAVNDGNKIWYERIPPKVNKKGTALLIMGNGQDALAWPPNFFSAFTDAGYQIIRFDHRGTGLSTYGKKWKKLDPYTLNDMANDAIAILDTLAIEKAHIVGASMGGMIAQLIAIEHPERTATLTSIMSSGNVVDDNLPPMSDDVLPKMISTVLNHGFFGNKKGQIKRQIIQKRILMGEATGEIDVKTLSEVAYYNLKERDGYNLMAARHHFAAILLSGSRYDQLSKLKIPVLLIHGEKDPVMPIEHSKKLDSIIPGSTHLWIENMGHDLPDEAMPEITAEIISNFTREKD